MKKCVFWVLILSSLAFGQSRDFTDYFNARFAKGIGLGNAYAGYAQGIETIYYNPAGLAELKGYQAIISFRDGYAWIVNMSNNDFAVAAPLAEKTGTIAFSGNTISADFNDADSYSRIYSLAYARKLSGAFFAAINFNYLQYHYSNAQPVSADEEDIDFNLFDVGLSLLYKIKQIHQTGWDDGFGIGAYFNNLLDSKHEYSGGVKEAKAKFFRAGISYSFVPISRTYYDLKPLQIVLNVDGAFLLKKYSFKLWQPNYGVQLTLFEYLDARFGRQSEFSIKDNYGYSPQSPVKRFGLGLRMPVSDFMKLGRNVVFMFDYTYSDWDQIDENEGNPSFGLKKIKRSSYAFKLEIGR